MYHQRMILNYLGIFYLFYITDAVHKKQLCSEQYFYSIYSSKKKLLYELFIIIIGNFLKKIR